MKKKTFKNPFVVSFIALLVAMFSVFALNAHTVFAQGSGSGGGESLDVQQFNQNITGSDATADTGETCGGVKIAFNVGCRDDFSNPIIAYLVAILRFLTYGVGIVVTLMIVIGGVQYAAAGDNAQSVAAAKSRIFNAVIALILYIFAFAILNFIVPGGLIG